MSFRRWRKRDVLFGGVFVVFVAIVAISSSDNSPSVSTVTENAGTETTITAFPSSPTPPGPRTTASGVFIRVEAIQPTATAVRAESLILLVEGVRAVRSLNITGTSEGERIAYLEVDTFPDHNTLATAMRIYLVAHTILRDDYGWSPRDSLFFSVILWDNTDSAVDYVYTTQEQEWGITELSVTPSATLPVAAAATSECETIFITQRANIRPCPGTTGLCAPIGSVGAGDTVLMISSIEGEEVAGSAIWYQVIFDGHVAYIHSSLVSKTDPSLALPSSNQPPPEPQSSPQSGPTGVDCGGVSKCSEITSCEQAYACLQAGYTGLDRDHDGVPCEDICPGG